MAISSDRRVVQAGGGGLQPLRTVDNSVYSAVCFEAEIERIFRRCWYLLCHESEVPSAGSYLRRQLGGDPVVVVRGGDGIVRGFHNVCRHRGCLVVPAEHGCERTLTCPYHAWVYSISDGTLSGLPQLDAYEGTGFDTDDFGLMPIQVENLHGFVFGSIDLEGPSLQTYLGNEALELVGQTFADVDLEVFHFEATPFQANWKTFAENIRDGYHVPFVHPWLRRASPPQRYTLLGAHHALQRLQLGRDAVTDDEWEVTTRYPLPGLEDGNGYILTIFPDTLFVARSSEVHTMTVVPRTAEETVLEIRVLGVKGDPPEVRASRKACFDLWSARQPPEDIEVLQYQQEGLRSHTVKVSLVGRGQDASSGLRGDDNRLRQFWVGWRHYMGLAQNEFPLQSGHEGS